MLTDNKNDLRKKFIQKRTSLTQEEVLAASTLIVENIRQFPQYVPAKEVMIYWPKGNEVSLKSLVDDEKVFYLPTVCNKKIEPILYTGEKDLIIGKYGICEPCDSKKKPKLLDLVIVPGIIFDKFGNRVGFGKGYYDIFLSGLKTIKVGVAFSWQIVESLPAESHDVSMDLIVTESGIINCQKTDKKL